MSRLRPAKTRFIFFLCVFECGRGGVEGDKNVPLARECVELMKKF